MPSVFGVLSPCSIGNELTALMAAGTSSDLTSPGAPGVANVAIYVPVNVSETITIVKCWWVNGGTVSGNIDLGLYPETGGAKLVTLGSTAMSGANAVQEGNIADTVVPPGRYLMAMAWSSATATFDGPSINSLTASRFMQTIGVAMQTSGAFALPASATPIAFNSASCSMIPLFGFSQRTLVA